MSINIDVFLRAERMLTPEQWQITISGYGFGLELDTDFDPETFAGYLPCRYKGVECGFEYFRLSVAKVAPPADVLRLVGARDTVVNFTTRSDYRDLVASVIGSGALCAAAGGVIFGGGEESPITGTDAISWARLVEADLSRHL